MPKRVADHGSQPEHAHIDEQTGRKRIPRGLVTETQDQILDERLAAVEADDKILEDKSQHWDLSDIFYETRNRLDAAGYNVDELSKRRKTMNAHVKDYCDEIGKKRHELGIFVAIRAMFAYKGELHGVGYEDIDWLASLGTDIICIEKASQAQKLVPFTKDYGIAFLQSEGFMSEFGGMLAQKAKENGANVAIVTDFDVSGVQLAFELEGIPRIGIDFTTIDELNKQNKGLNLQIAKVRERYKGGSHWKGLDKLMHYKKPEGGKSRKDIPIEETEHELKYIDYLNQTRTITTVDRDGNETEEEIRYIDYLKDRRIELNSIFTRIGEIKGDKRKGPELFWKWLKSKITDTDIFESRDYNRAINVPEYVLTEAMRDFRDKLQKSITNYLQYTVDNYRDDLTEVSGLLNTNEKYREIYFGLLDEVLENPKYERIDSTLQDLIDRLDQEDENE